MNNDLISREALKEHKFLTPQFKVIGGRRCGKIREQIIEAYQKGWNDCIDAIIDNAPTVEPERPQGKWIVDGESIFENYKKCSNCGEDAEWLDGGSQFLSKFCPNCGADMRGDNK